MHSYSFNKKEAFPLAGLLSNVMVEAANLLSKVDIWNAWNLTKLDMRSRLTGGSVPMKKGSTANAALWEWGDSYHPFGSMPRRSSSLRPSVFIQLAKLIPADEAAASNCALSSGVMRILNWGDCPSPLGLLSRLIVDKWSPIKLVSVVIGGHLSTVKPIKTTPPKGITSTRRGLTTNDSESIEVAMQNHTTPLTWRNSLSPNKFTWRFLALSRIDREAKPCRLSVVAPTEREARQVLAPHFILSFSTRLPVQEVRHA